MSEPRNHNHMIIFAFRYGLDRRTGAPYMICNYIKANIDQLNNTDINQICDDIARYRPGEISSDWNDLLTWFKENGH